MARAGDVPGRAVLAPPGAKRPRATSGTEAGSSRLATGKLRTPGRRRETTHRFRESTSPGLNDGGLFGAENGAELRCGVVCGQEAGLPSSVGGLGAGLDAQFGEDVGDVAH